MYIRTRTGMFFPAPELAKQVNGTGRLLFSFQGTMAYEKPALYKGDRKFNIENSEVSTHTVFRVHLKSSGQAANPT